MSVFNPMKHRLIIGSAVAALILTGCGVSQKDYDALKSQNDQLQMQNQQLTSQNQQLQQQLATSQAQTSRLQGAIKYTVNSDLLFPSGGYEMSDQGKTIIARLAKKLAPTQQNHLFVNGYTDNVPIGAALQAQGITSNQVLSEKRAQNVMDFLISQGVSQDLVSAHGFGEADPIASNDTSAGRAQNRRVELTLQPPGS
jgi:chemotaxis protein MotB